MSSSHLTLSLLLVVGSAGAQEYVISTYAGGASLPTPIAALDVPIGSATAVCVDPADNVYFVGLNAVFKLDRDGILTRVAGSSRQGYGGDGGPAVNAELFGPRGIAVDSDGNLFIADSWNQRVR